MPSTYTNSLRLVLPATGELTNTWGTVFNAGATSLIDASIAGTASITMTAANYTLSNANGAADEARAMFLVLGGTPGASYNVICPAVSKLYFVTNNTGFAQTVKTSAGSGISVPNGARMALRCNGTDVVEALNYVGSLTLGSPLAVGSGGTGAATFTANNVLLGNGTSAFQVVAPGATGNILTSNGTTWQSAAPVVTGVSSITFGSTGLTPSTATSGAVTVAGTLAATNGGTGQTTYAVGDLLFASTTTALSKLADVATGNALISGGVGVAPSYGKIGLTTHVSGTLPVGNGGTGLTTYAVGDIVYASATGTLASLADVATGNALISGGVGVAPSYGKIGLTTHVSGTLPVANGGTNGTATPTAGTIAYGTGTAYAFNTAGTSGQPLLSGGSGAPTFGTLGVAAGGTGQTTYTDGQLLIGNTATTSLSKATLTAGSGVTITNGNGSITIAATGSGGTVTSVGATAPVASSGGTAPTISLNAAYGDTLNPYASKTANFILAAPNGTAGVPSFRAVVAADIPTLNQNTTGTAANITATSNSTLTTLSALSLPGSQVSGNISGNAANVTGTVAVGNGGTGITTGTSGGVPYFSAASTIASSAALAANALVVGGGAGVAPSTVTTGTGVVTALGVNTGTAGAFVVNGGALGTPSSGTVTNLTGTASININGTVGATTANTGNFTSVTSTSEVVTGAAGVLTRAAATQDGIEMVGRAGGTTSLKVTLTPTTLTASRTVTLPDANINFATGLGVANGGTGATTLTANNVILGNGTSAVQFVAPGANGNVLTSNGTTWTSAAASASLTGQTDSASPFETALGVGAGAVNTGVNNTFIGYEAGNDNTTGTSNTAVGYQALDVNTTGASNTAVGAGALGANTTGFNNEAFGFSALGANTTGVYNTAVGSSALTNNTFGANNVAVGRSTLLSNTTGNNNTALGYSALVLNTTGVDNTAVGYQALDANTTGIENTALGSNALGAVTTGSQNTSLGFNAGNSITTGASNVAIGRATLAFNTTTGTNNIAVGNSALTFGSSGDRNIAIGQSAMFGLGGTPSGSENIAIGYQSLDANTTGSNNIALGSNALGANTTASNNVAIGQNVLAANTTGADNTAVGAFALDANTVGTQNTAIGSNALGANTTGTLNTAVGHLAADAVNTGSEITAVGANAAGAITTGTQSVAIGSYALLTATTPSRNTAIGTNALQVCTTGANNTAVGWSAGGNITTGTNNTLIGHNASASAATVSNEITLGDASVATIRAQVTTITALSDARDKTDIAPLSAGLAFTNALKPVAFTWNMRDGGKVGVPDTGFIAQDLKAVQEQTGVSIPGLVYESNPDRLEAGYGKLLPVLVKAIQELSAEVESLKAQLKGN